MTNTEADIIGGRRIWMRLGETQAGALARADSRRWPVVNRRLLEHNSHAKTENDVVSPLVNATMLVKREILDQVQFSSSFRGNAWREESDFQLQAQTIGHRVVFCPHALFFHHDRLMAGRGSSRLLSNIRYLYWIFRNNIVFLRRNRDYLKENIPESLIMGSPRVTSAFYIIYRGVLLIQTEARRSLASRKLARSAAVGHARSE